METTKYEPRYAKKVIVEVPHDDLTLDDILEELIAPALIGLTFCPDMVYEALGLKEEELNNEIMEES